jgi:hypothetical protein
VVVWHCLDGGAHSYNQPVPSTFRRARWPDARWPICARRRAHCACHDRRDRRRCGSHQTFLAAGPRRHHDRHVHHDHRLAPDAHAGGHGLRPDAGVAGLRHARSAARHRAA